MNRTPQQNDFPYAIEERRALREDEKLLLAFLFEREKIEPAFELDELVVIGRCGCGQCSGIMIGSPQRTIQDFQYTKSIAGYLGQTSAGVKIVVSLLEKGNGIYELEAWYPEEIESDEWPEISSLTKIRSEGESHDERRGN